MLCRLSVENLGVFEREAVELGAGLCVITGETGAGKTMLLSALGLVTGESPQKGVVGPGGASARVEAEFDAPTPEPLRELLSEARDPEDPLVLARELRDGKPARAFACGVSCSAAQLRESRSELISLTGQHAARRLTSASYQLGLIDSALAEQGRETLTQTRSAWEAWREAVARLEELRGDALEKARRAEMLKHESELFSSLEPEDAEEDELRSRIERLANATEIAEAIAQAREGLADAVVVEIDRLAALCESAGSVELRELAARMSSAREELADVSLELARMDLEEADPARLDELNLRLSELTSLRRRFGGASIAEIRAQIESSAEELAVLENLEEAIAQRTAEEERARREYTALTEKLSSHRARAAKRWIARVEEELSALSLPEAKLGAQWSEAAPSASGADSVELTLQANPGLQPAPLGKGASGGELSRVHLAVVLASIWSGKKRGDSQAQPAYLFDEVDAGIGGMTAHSVAESLKKLADAGAQVIVVTHLAQIAKRADTHLVVRKDLSGDRARTQLLELRAEEDRHAELARLVGLEDTEAGALLAKA